MCLNLAIMKTCSKCKAEKPLEQFHKDRSTRDGLKGRCRSCDSELRKRQCADKAKTSAMNRAYHEKNRATIMAKKRARYHADLEGRRAARREWEHANKWRTAAYAARKRAQRRQAVPRWLTPEMRRQIRDIYKNCPPGHQVDHIMPIRGKEVCGLHVPWNLQYLPAEENLKKGNRVVR